MTAAPESQAATVCIWMPWFIKDHRAFVSTLTHFEHSAYCFFRMHLWMHGGEVPDDEKSLARELKISVAQLKKIRAVLMRDCEIHDGVIREPAMKAEYAKALANNAQKKAAGRASAAARAASKEGNGRSTDVPTGVATDVPTGVPTARQPRAGGGGGPYQGRTFDGVDVEDEPFGLKAVGQ